MRDPGRPATGSIRHGTVDPASDRPSRTEPTGRTPGRPLSPASRCGSLAGPRHRPAGRQAPARRPGGQRVNRPVAGRMVAQRASCHVAEVRPCAIRVAGRPDRSVTRPLTRPATGRAGPSRRDEPRPRAGWTRAEGPRRGSLTGSATSPPRGQRVNHPVAGRIVAQRASCHVAEVGPCAIRVAGRPDRSVTEPLTRPATGRPGPSRRDEPRVRAGWTRGEPPRRLAVRPAGQPSRRGTNRRPAGQLSRGGGLSMRDPGRPATGSIRRGTVDPRSDRPSRTEPAARTPDARPVPVRRYAAPSTTRWSAVPASSASIASSGSGRENQ